MEVVARGPRTDVGDACLPGQVGRLLLDVLGEPAPPADLTTRPSGSSCDGSPRFAQRSGPLLATPDLLGGWVRPVAFVERLAQNPSSRHST